MQDHSPGDPSGTAWFWDFMPLCLAALCFHPGSSSEPAPPCALESLLTYLLLRDFYITPKKELYSRLWVACACQECS